MASKLKNFLKKIFIVYHINLQFDKHGKSISIIFVPVATAVLLAVEYKMLGSLDPISLIKKYTLGFDVSFDEKMLIYLYLYLLANLVYAIRIKPANKETSTIEETTKPKQTGEQFKNQMQKSSAVKQVKERIKESGEGIANDLSIEKVKKLSSEETQKQQRRKESTTIKPTKPINEEDQKELERVLQGTLWQTVKRNANTVAINKTSKKEEILSKMNRKL